MGSFVYLSSLFTELRSFGSVFIFSANDSKTLIRVLAKYLSAPKTTY